MSDVPPIAGTESAGRAPELGVVDPIRIPGAERIAREWRRLPALGRVFVAAALVDLVARLLGIGGLSLLVDLGVPLSLFLFFLGHYALVLFPVALLARRREAVRTTPLLVGGAVAIALVELLEPYLGLVFHAAGPDLTGWTTVRVAASLINLAAFVALAMGLARIDRSIPSPNLAGLANLVGIVIASAAAVGLLRSILGSASFGDPAWDGQIRLAGFVAQLPLFAFALLARTVVRGAGDDRRPRLAVTLAAAAMALAAAVTGLNLVVETVALVQTAFAVPGDLSGAFAFAGLGPSFFVLLLVVAFALGLGDASATMPGRGLAGIDPWAADAEPAPDAVAWPTFEDDNVPYHPELVPTREPEAAPAKRKARALRRRKGQPS